MKILNHKHQFPKGTIVGASKAMRETWPYYWAGLGPRTVSEYKYVCGEKRAREHLCPSWGEVMIDSQGGTHCIFCGWDGKDFGSPVWLGQPLWEVYTGEDSNDIL